jgi:hypothetical protein
MAGVGSSGLMLTEENLRMLNAEMRNYEMHKRDKFTDIIERQVTDFLDSLDKKVRVQLSKTQLIKSLQKAYKWKKEVRSIKKTSNGKAVPREFLDSDFDPGTYKEKLFKQVLARYGGDLSALASSSGSNTTSSTTSGGGLGTGLEKMGTVLDGDHFEKNILPHCPSREKNTSISAKRPIAMKARIRSPQTNNRLDGYSTTTSLYPMHFIFRIGLRVVLCINRSVTG